MDGDVVWRSADGWCGRAGRENCLAVASDGGRHGVKVLEHESLN